MSYPAYPEYKDSGVEWLGEVPAHWKVKRLRYVAELNPSKSEVRSLPAESYASFIPMEAVGDDGSLSLDQTRPINEVLAGYTYVREGDVTIAKITPCFENGKGAVMRGLKNHVGFGTTELTVMRPKAELTTSNYLYRVVSSEPFRVLGESSMYGAGGQKRVPDEFVRNFTIAWPPFKEQAEIQDFLDHETARIDALVEEQQRLIELLKEKRQAVISHAVTKGLDPDVPMRDSGVEWLGEVPEHWDVVRIKNVSSFLTSGPRGWSDFINDEGEDIFLQSGDLDNHLNILFDKAKRITTPQGAEGVRTRLQNNDVVVCITGANTGRVAVINEVKERAYVNQHLGLIRPHASLFCSRFLGYSLASIGGQTYFNVEQYGLKEGLSLTNLAEAPTTLPSLTEQSEIAQQIDTQLNHLDGLSTDAEVAIKLLQERRSALISAAVTGKIDVRGWQPPADSAVATGEVTQMEAV
ncbi:restriction endonuclease subunit S [Vreelandella janggokensis]|uniref:restriction endonuclease subunit S n=1 Tax=Vreelandella janggokensis TaxID=370767 RepID=UPI00285C50A2|nr:restriction endonuclease subunit S [Halomonas janggokensis]MDR5884630.1 restriction endonuclease subunit S [Halomonas janggokensis]